MVFVYTILCYRQKTHCSRMHQPLPGSGMDYFHQCKWGSSLAHLNNQALWSPVPPGAQPGRGVSFGPRTLPSAHISLSSIHSAVFPSSSDSDASPALSPLIGRSEVVNGMCENREERRKRSLGKATSPARINVRTAETPLIFHHIKLPLVS